ncbi:MAG: regulatory protein RecX [Endomicrobiales bacterium]|jgi:regulatory protein
MKELYTKALAYALSLLSLRARSRRELEEKLSAKKYDRAIVDAVLVRLTELNYVNDERFAHDFFNFLVNKGKGADAIRFELLKKGIATELITDILRVYKEDPDTEIEQIINLARNRFKRMQASAPGDAARRLMGFLVRRGFSIEGIQKALRQLDNEIRQHNNTLQ